MKKIGWFSFALCTICIFFSPLRAAAAPIIALDPGHGGTNLGADYLLDIESNILEKDLTLALAKLIEEELEKNGVKVFLLRTEDVSMSLAERAEYASEQNAQFIISLHFNASESHTLYGTEIWVSSQESYYRTAYPLAQNMENELKSLGLLSRGIKVRISGDNSNDYYGIIREGVSKNIPTILVEHCFLDHERDMPFWKTQEALERLAKADANGIISYLSTEHQIPELSDLSRPIPDNTPPEIQSLFLKESSSEYWRYQADIKEPESALTYYAYMLDTDQSWSELFPLSSNTVVSDQYSLKVPAILGATNIKFRIYNGYDLYSESQSIPIAYSNTSEGSSSTDGTLLPSHNRINIVGHIEILLWGTLYTCMLSWIIYQIFKLANKLYFIKQKSKYYFLLINRKLTTIWEDAPDLTVYTDLQQSLQSPRSDLMLYIKMQSVNYINKIPNMNLNHKELKNLCLQERFKAVKNREIDTKGLYMILNQINALDYVINTYNSIDIDDQEMMCRFYEQLYYKICTDLKVNIFYQSKIFEKITNGISWIFHAKKQLAADQVNNSIVLYEKNDKLILLPIIYIYIIHVLGNHQSDHLFAFLVIFTLFLRCDIFPFPIDIAHAYTIMSSKQNYYLKKENLIQLFYSEQAECLKFILDV